MSTTQVHPNKYAEILQNCCAMNAYSTYKNINIASVSNSSNRASLSALLLLSLLSKRTQNATLEWPRYLWCHIALHILLVADYQLRFRG